MTAKEALEILKSKNTTLKLNHKIGNRDIAINEVKGITKGIDSILPIIEQALDELEELKKDITRFLYLQTGRIPFTGAFVQDFIIENKPHPLADQLSVERNLKKEYKEIKEKLERLGDKNE